MTTWKNSGGVGPSNGTFVTIPNERRFRAWEKAEEDDILASSMVVDDAHFAIFFRTRPLNTKWHPGPSARDLAAPSRLTPDPLFGIPC